MLNNTASPIIVLIPVATTFVGYNIGIINQGLAEANIGESGYSILVQSIPFQFFSIVLILITFLGIYFDYKPKWVKNEKDEDESETSHEGMDMQMKETDFEISPRLRNMIIPLVLLVVLSFGMIAYFGMQQIEQGSGLIPFIANAEPTKAMLLALFVTLITTAFYYLTQGYQLKSLSSDLISGGNDLMSTLSILVLAWPLASLSQDLGLGELIRQSMSHSLPSIYVPVIIFLITSLITYFIGSSWGAWALLMPVAIPLAVATGASIPITAAAVLSGGTFGDVTSPVSGMTHMSANITKSNHMRYIKYAYSYNIFSAIIAAILFFIVPMLI
jgi:Na+/H+ antiporter NhaC